MTPALIGTGLALALAASSNRRGTTNVDAAESLRESLTGAPHPGLDEYYPETAKGTLEPYLGGDIFWAGSGPRRVGYAGPTDGTMVPIEARYAHPIAGNIFDDGKFSALVEAIADYREPVVRPGYAHLSLVDSQTIRESQEYESDIEWGEAYGRDDLGALAAQVRDGNHRTFAALAAGAPFVWVRMSDLDKQFILSAPKGHERRANKLYTAIRKAQKSAGAPLIKRPRRKRVRPQVLSQLQTYEARYTSLEADIEKLQRLQLKQYDEYNTDPRPLYERLERPGLFLRFLFKDLRTADEDMFRRVLLSPESKARRALQKEKESLWSKLYDLRKAVGTNVFTGLAR